ncbi:hypothetical protein FDG95_gp349 [Pectobacterium phage vB_PcaM_CBB]|uniref:Uncharacterized protein n=1 Tax=Pectobacterium phage vB_PcaM_CBB TaxID=2772511 RepID=A0A1L2CV55_9CAUD|nr:hypothetical protein FDG95_gp349 [Pectobacterium phage vB_PcaM_CBB]AMM43912.1 hypothetical protein CBB_349 [Pectobacterium phage vB_PcaM_CBB]
MNKTKNVLQVVVNFETAESVQELKNLIQSKVGDVDIVRYSVNPTNVVLYVLAEPSANLHTIQVEDTGKTYSTINVVESIVEDGTKEYTGTVQEAFAEVQTSEPKPANVIIFEHDPKLVALLNKEYKLSNVSVYDGLVSISTEDEIVLIEPQVNVTIDYSTYNESTGTVKLVQTKDEESSIIEAFNNRVAEIQEEELSSRDFSELVSAIDNIDNDRLSLTEQFKDSIFGPGIAKAEDYARMSTERNTINLMSDIMNTFNAIENDLPYKLPVEALAKMDEHERNVHEMKNILLNVQGLGEEISMAAALKEDVSHTTVKEVAGASQSGFVDEDDDDIESLSAYSIGDTVVETVTLKVALISFNAFDEYAANHNIVGWDLFTPTTLLIKYMEEGVTSEEKIKKFHEMMDSLDTGWVQKVSDETKFLSEFKQVLDRDVTQEFLARVKKHNVFVRENLAKIRSALLDMEKDYEELKDEVNLTIDWENLTAFASKKERIEHRVRGVQMVFSGSNRPDANVVRVDSEYEGKDFYIPFSLITDEIREKYVLDNELLYIENVPDFAFYEVPVNGHVMIIEKTDL